MEKELTHKQKIEAKAIATYGSLDAWKQVMREYGSKARRDTPRGFARMSKERVKQISKLGVEGRKHAKNSSKDSTQYKNIA